MWITLWAALACTPSPEDTGADTELPDSDSDSETDSETDSDSTDSDSEPSWEPDPTCDWIDMSIYAVQCGEITPSWLTEWVSISGDPSCPRWYEIDDRRGEDARAVLDAAECDRTCVYRMHQAVMMLYCDVRGEYITYLPEGPGQDGDGTTCPVLAEFHTVAGSGWYPDLEAYSAEHPCPE